MRALLNERQQALFFRASRRTQRHAFDVYQTLLAQGQREPSLLVAALLHDAGNGQARTWEKVAYVLLKAASPGLLRRLAEKPQGFWAGLHRCLYHPELGAAMAARSGASAETVRLILEHHAPVAREPLLRALQRADEAN